MSFSPGASSPPQDRFPQIVWDKVGITTHAAPGLAKWYGQHGAYAAIVRPDRYVYRLARAPGDLDTLTAVLTAHGL